MIWPCTNSCKEQLSKDVPQNPFGNDKMQWTLYAHACVPRHHTLIAEVSKRDSQAAYLMRPSADLWAFGWTFDTGCLRWGTRPPSPTWILILGVTFLFEQVKSSWFHSTTSLRMLLPGPRAPPTCTTSKAAPEKPKSEKPASPERSPVKLRSPQHRSHHRDTRSRHRHRPNHRRRSPSHRRHRRRSQRSRSHRRARSHRRSRSRRHSGSLAWGRVVQSMVVFQDFPN